MATPYLLLDVQTEGLISEVRFNDVAIVREGGRELASRALRLNGWALPGANMLEVRLAAAPEAGAPARFILRLRQGEPGAPDATDVALADYQWPAGQPAPPALAPVFNQPVQLEAFGVWDWVRATAIPVAGVGDLADIGALLERLHDALERRDIDEVVALQAAQVGEQAASIGMAPEDALGAYRSFLEERMGSADWRVAPFDRPAIRAEAMAGGRVQHVTDQTGGPPITTLSGEGQFLIDPYVARIRGDWKIVR